MQCVISIDGFYIMYILCILCATNCDKTVYIVSVVISYKVYNLTERVLPFIWVHFRLRVRGIVYGIAAALCLLGMKKALFSSNLTLAKAVLRCVE